MNATSNIDVNEVDIVARTLRYVIQRNAPKMFDVGIAYPVYKTRIIDNDPVTGIAVDSLEEKAATVLKHIFITSDTVPVNTRYVLWSRELEFVF